MIKPIMASFMIPFQASVFSALAPQSIIRKPHHTTIIVAQIAIIVVIIGMRLKISSEILLIHFSLASAAFPLHVGKKLSTSIIKVFFSISPVNPNAIL